MPFLRCSCPGPAAGPSWPPARTARAACFRPGKTGKAPASSKGSIRPGIPHPRSRQLIALRPPPHEALAAPSAASASLAAPSSSPSRIARISATWCSAASASPVSALVAKPETAAVRLQGRREPRAANGLSAAAPSPRPAPCLLPGTRRHCPKSPPSAWPAPRRGKGRRASRVTNWAAERASTISTPRRASMTRSQSAACSGAIAMPARGRTSSRPSQASRWIASRTGVRPRPTRSISAPSVATLPGRQFERDDHALEDRDRPAPLAGSLESADCDLTNCISADIFLIYHIGKAIDSSRSNSDISLIYQMESEHVGRSLPRRHDQIHRG